MLRWAVAAALVLIFGGAHAEGARAYGAMGGWAYDITGTYTNTSELDLQDDLGLRSTARADYALGYVPAGFGWLPTLEFGYTRIAADGQQTFSLLPVAPISPVVGLLPVSNETVVDDRTNINDFELTARWPWQLGQFTVLSGFTVTTLNGTVVTADESSGQQQTQKVNEIFPLLSLGLDWQPLPSLRFSLSGDYVQYKSNRADELEARVLWKFLGPVGVETGYRQRRYKIIEPMNSLDARVSGVLVRLVMELPL